MALLVNPEVERRVAALEIPFNAAGVDPYGIERRTLARWMSVLAWLHRKYFRVRVEGIEHVPARGRAMLVGNHSGGVAIDGAMVIATCFLEMDPPRLAQGMVERFMDHVPFAATWAARCGQFTGLPENAVHLLHDERLLMVFPEGARGTAKLFPERDSLVEFGTGFLRLALQTRTPIVPFGFVGGGEAIPTVFNAYQLGRAIGVPYVPITPYVVPLPLPAKLSVHFGAPLVFEGTGREDDEIVDAHVERVKREIARLVAQGRAQRSRPRGALTGGPR